MLLPMWRFRPEVMSQPPAIIRWGKFSLDPSRHALMGVLNVTPDSFSDGGHFQGIEAALRHGRQLVADGAAILDVGGMSTRPGAEEISVEEERRRVVPVIAALAREVSVPISIDAYRPEVVAAALEAGAAMVNDVTGLQRDGTIARLAADAEVPVIAMHMQGMPRTMQVAPHYEDVVVEIRAYLLRAVESAVAAGVPEERVIIDPGIGFGKTIAHNHAILTNLDAFVETGQPVLVGASRKSFLGTILGVPPLERDAGSAEVAAFCAKRGVSISRVHNVRACREGATSDRPDHRRRVRAWLEEPFPEVATP